MITRALITLVAFLVIAAGWGWLIWQYMLIVQRTTGH